jgi:hypothetical protein
MSDAYQDIVCFQDSDKRFVLTMELSPGFLYIEEFQQRFLGSFEQFIALKKELPLVFSNREEVNDWFNNKKKEGFSFV